jgi:dipeptidyl aminopeptidase/acylaminoacyl peptidase
MVLEEGDRPEHLPWVRKGFAVVAFEIDGPLSDTTTKREAGEAIDAFLAAHAGIDDAKAAFDFAAARPEIDEKRIYIVGHSSAATLALQAAEHDPRIAACVAFAPACDLATRLEKATAFLDDLRPGTMDFLTEFSPDRHANDLSCPTMLFTARDDTNVPSASVLKFANQLQATNPRVKVITVNSGGHTESMLEQGIPAAVAFLQSLSNGNQP